MSTPNNRGQAAPGRTDASAAVAQMQAAIAEVGAQRDGAQARAVELAVTLAGTRARIAALEADVARLQAAEKEWRAMADAAKAS